MRDGMKVVLTGSNANLLSGELATHLTGRYNQISLYPFSFIDYCVAKNINSESISTKSKALRQRALDEYLMCGGFPEIVAGEEKISLVGLGYVGMPIAVAFEQSLLTNSKKSTRVG